MKALREISFFLGEHYLFLPGLLLTFALTLWAFNLSWAAPRQATIPWSVIQPQGHWHLHVGQSGWTMPAAMTVDHNRHAWLTTTYGLGAEDDITTDLELFVQRKADGYHVTVSCLTSFKWVLSPPPKDALPVAVFTNHEGKKVC